jgi:putative glycosyl hydrolase-like family 15 (GHL15) protein
VKRLSIAAAVVIATLVAVTTASGSSTVTSAAGAGFVDSSNGIHLWAPMHTAPHIFRSQAEAEAAAKRFDLITANPRQLGGYGSAMRAANPAMKLFVYLNGTYLYKRLVGTLPDSVLSHDARGAVIRSRGYGNVLGNPANPGWIAYVQTECAKLLAASPFDGCFLDMLGTGPLFPGYGTGLPIDPSTGKVWTRRDWLTTTAALAAKVATFTGKPMIGNGLGSGPRYFNPAGPASLLLQGATGATAEAWVRPAGAPLSWHQKPAAWQQEADMLSDAHTVGGLALTITKTWTAGSALQKADARKFALATFLLGNNGSSYFYFTANPMDPATLGDPLYELPIGSPTGPYTVSGGVYARAFTNGKVLVNPTGAAVTVPLGGTYVRSGGAAATSATLGAYEAEIFTVS